MSMETVEPESVGISSDRLRRIAPVMRSYVEQQGVVGISTLVARRGRIVHRQQFGYQDREADTLLSADTIYRIYSMTKPVVATALMMLHEEAKFHLDDPIASYIPSFAATRVVEPDGSLVDQIRPMNIRDVLTHTSGLTYDFMTDSPVAEMYREARIMNDASRSLGELIDVLAEIPLASQPGQRWRYSVGIDVAARLIEVLADQPVGDFIQDRLCGPLGMIDTDFGVPESKIGRLSAMYGLPDLVGRDYDGNDLVSAALAGFNERIDVAETYPTDAPDVFQRGGLGLFSTINDYLSFAQMLGDHGRGEGRQIIGPKTLELMHRNHLRADLLPYEILGTYNPGMGFGLGSRVMLDTAQFAGTGSDGEYGWAGAAKTYYWIDPKEDLVGLFMSQYMTGVLSPDRDFRSLVYQSIVE